jgi:hypothetical protein
VLSVAREKGTCKQPHNRLRNQKPTSPVAHSNSNKNVNQIQKLKRSAKDVCKMMALVPTHSNENQMANGTGNQRETPKRLLLALLPGHLDTKGLVCVCACVRACVLHLNDDKI